MDKYAYERLMGLTLNKRATNDSMVADTVGSVVMPEVTNKILANLTPHSLGTLAEYGGGLSAYLEPAADDPKAEIDKLNEHKYIGFIPGVGSYKRRRRVINTDKHYGSKHPRTRNFLRSLSGEAIPVTSAIIGSILGMKYFRSNFDGMMPPGMGQQIDMSAVEKLHGAMMGGGLGYLLGSIPNIIGAVAAGITKRRTDDEQRKASTGSYAKFLIPGYASYDDWKTMGKSRDIK